MRNARGERAGDVRSAARTSAPRNVAASGFACHPSTRTRRCAHRDATGSGTNVRCAATVGGGGRRATLAAVRHWFKIDREWVKWRERILIAQDDAALRLARDEAPTCELREFVQRVIDQRDRARGHDQPPRR